MEIGNGERPMIDTDLSTPQTDSFWEIGKYSRVVKRCEDGNRLTTDLIAMINERAELEKTFSKLLRSWSKKWSEYVTKSPEFGTMTSAWRALMNEADATADVHQSVHDEIENDVVPSIKLWQKNKYIKSMMHVKCTKEFEEEFKRAQKPWAKLYMKVDKYKREYHAATKTLKLAETQENNSKLDGSIPADQRSKITEKVERGRKEKEAAKSKYTEALQELNRANPKYMDDMKDVFDRCQSFERDRLVKYKEFLINTEKCLDISNRLRAPIFQQFSQTIKNCNPDEDLSFWSDTYGATMKMNWPVFEEYSETHRTLSRRGKNDIERDNTVVVTAIRSNNGGTSNNAIVADNRLSNNYAYSPSKPTEFTATPSVYPVLPTTSAYDSNPFDDDDDDNNNRMSYTNKSIDFIDDQRSTYPAGTTNGNYSLPPYAAPNTQSFQQPVSYPASANPFLDDDDNVDSLSSPIQSSHQSPPSAAYSSNESSAGVPVRALYDYEAQEPDELSFKQGEVFTKLEDEDDQGWCKGRVGNRVGLYPATYVQAI